jgi:isoleucyl-tRNA synthetase
VLVFTSEEVWGTRFPDAGSVHLLEWPEIPPVDADEDKWNRLRGLRDIANAAIEPKRREKVIGSSLEAELDISVFGEWERMQEFEALDPSELAELCIVSAAKVVIAPGADWPADMAKGNAGAEIGVHVRVTGNHKCGRCWRYLPEVEEDGSLCDRCEDYVDA